MMADMSSCESPLNPLVDDSERPHVVDAKATSDKKEPRIRLSTLVPDLDSEAESGRNQVLVEKLDFLRDSCKIVLAQKNRLLARQDEDISRLRALLAQKIDEVASLKAHLDTVHRTVATVTIERDEAVARASIAAYNLDQTHADHDIKIASLKLQATDVESSTETLPTMFQQQKIELKAALLENNELNAQLTRARDVYDSLLESCRSQEVGIRDLVLFAPTLTRYLRARTQEPLLDRPQRSWCSRSDSRGLPGSALYLHPRSTDFSHSCPVGAASPIPTRRYTGLSRLPLNGDGSWRSVGRARATSPNFRYHWDYAPPGPRIATSLLCDLRCTPSTLSTTLRFSGSSPDRMCSACSPLPLLVSPRAPFLRRTRDVCCHLLV